MTEPTESTPLAQLMRDVEPDPAYTRPAALASPPGNDAVPLSYLESDGLGTYQVCQAIPAGAPCGVNGNDTDERVWLRNTLAYRASLINAVHLVDGMRALRGEVTSS